jgi:putative MATE family efflux protein
MSNGSDFTQGKILGPLLKFALPVMAAIFLQDMYGAVDLLIVGRFASSVDVSGVSTGSQIMISFTHLVVNFAIGITVLLGQQIGRGEREKGGRVIGAGIVFFAIIGAVLSAVMFFFAEPISRYMQAPEEAFENTVTYIRICGGGSLIMIAYNLIGCIFRGLGDSRTPLIAVLLACGFNVAGDLILVGVFGMGSKGAAIATVAAQAFSIVVSLWMVSKKQLSFDFSFRDIRWHGGYVRTMTRIGAPVALQEFMVSISFLVILAIVNTLGVAASAGFGVAEKICAIIMLVPASFMQSLAAFVAQNAGAKKYDRAIKALKYSIGISFMCGVAMAAMTFFGGEFLTGLFTKDPEVIYASYDYLKAYAIDCMLTPFFFCFVGFCNGLGHTGFVMAQGIISAFCVRMPVSYLMSILPGASLFRIGLATPMASALQILMCVGFMSYLKRKGFLES